MRVVIVLLLTLAALPAFAQSPSTGFKCPGTGNLISIGASRYEVRTKCREPDDAATTFETRTVTRRVRRAATVEERRARVRQTAKDATRIRVDAAEEFEVEELVSSVEDVEVERWTFDFGVNRFLRFLRFENGVLVGITDGPKGVAERQ